MRDEARIPEMCDRLARAWAHCPDLRLGQLMYGVTSYVLCQLEKDDFYMEDEEFMRCIEHFCSKVAPNMSINNGGTHE